MHRCGSEVQISPNNIQNFLTIIDHAIFQPKLGYNYPVKDESDMVLLLLLLKNLVISILSASQYRSSETEVGRESIMLMLLKNARVWRWERAKGCFFGQTKN
ncbi:hypothetical protein JTE90_022105 [Oedothorax gibbosus]|uniref:Uncharacterized protein n=1 Tax=Oedothorax gibbosus TaxID=931172 RepID=A0AAV6U0B1_9ARAC|nr:hypothetical protein JTE90_022105 [Oedothorax gibbosus]